MTERFKVSFTDEAFAALELPKGTEVALHLTVQNSPILFGCRTGLCGTCAAVVEDLSGALPPPTRDEIETLELAFDGPPPKNARLLCQLRLAGNIRITAREGAAVP